MVSLDVFASPGGAQERFFRMFSICSRQYLINTLIPVIYKQVHSPYGPHDLACLLIVLGMCVFFSLFSPSFNPLVSGTLVDLNLEPYNLEAQHYYRLSRATLALQSVLSEPSLVAVKVSLPLDTDRRSSARCTRRPFI